MVIRPPSGARPASMATASSCAWAARSRSGICVKLIPFEVVSVRSLGSGGPFVRFFVHYEVGGQPVDDAGAVADVGRSAWARWASRNQLPGVVDGDDDRGGPSLAHEMPTCPDVGVRVFVEAVPSKPRAQHVYDHEAYVFGR